MAAADLRFGMNLTATHPATSPPHIQIAEHRETIRAARDLGFDLIVAGQHYGAPELRYFQPVPYLASLNEWTEGMRLAVGIIVLPLHNPLAIAEDIATLDALTGGRAILGVGIGYSQREFDAFGVERGTRIAKFEESIATLRPLLEGTTVKSDGEFFQLSGTASSTLPVRPEGIPLWIGAQAPPSVRRAARLGDAWYAPPFPTHSELVELWHAYRETRAASGKSSDVEFPVRREIFITDSRSEAMRAIELAEQRYKIYASWGLDLSATYTEAGWFDSRFIVGSPSIVAERLSLLMEEVPMSHLVYKPQWVGLDHRDALAQLERFGTEVVPLLTGR